ncbi:MAG: hypothetical protein ACOYMN_25000 [Roseimicrobium sp.]
MNRFEPQRLITREGYWQFENSAQVEFIAHGEDSRHALLWRVIDQLETTQAKATHLLASFMKDSGEFTLASVTIFPETCSDGVDFAFRFEFEAGCNRTEYTYTYFDVFFADRQQPSPHFWACKFTIGFH